MKRLFAVSGNRCAFPECPDPLVDPTTGSIIGEVCHVKGEKLGAARYDSSQTNEERHGFDNLILLCGMHHKIIDDNPEQYPVDLLGQWKASHEAQHQGVAVDEKAAKRFIVHHGSLVTSYHQTGGQTAHSIKNIYQGAAPPSVNPSVCEIPELPLHFVPRPEQVQALKDVVLRVTRPVAVVGLRGMGGIGKSVLAACLAREADVRVAFPDGIFWVVVGQTPSVESLHAGLAAQWGQPHGRLRQAFADKNCLVILDDVWDAEHAMAFRALGPNVRMLLTTRDASLIHVLGAAEYCLDQLTDDQTLDMLAAWSGEPREQIPQAPAVRAVMRECGNLPLAIAVCGAMRRDGVTWTEIQAALEQADLSALYGKIPGCTYNTVVKSLHVGVKFLRRTAPEVADRYLELAVFPEDAVVPEAAVATLWAEKGFPAHRVGITLTQLHQKSLLRIDGTAPSRRVSVHDLQRDYVRASQKDLLGLHESLLKGYRKRSPKGWHNGPNDGYFFQQLGYHLVQAGRRDELRTLLFDFRWLQAQLDATDPNVVIADCDRCSPGAAAFSPLPLGEGGG